MSLVLQFTLLYTTVPSGAHLLNSFTPSGMPRHTSVVSLQAFFLQTIGNNELREPGNEASISHVQPHITVYGCIINACDPNC